MKDFSKTTLALIAICIWFAFSLIDPLFNIIGLIAGIGFFWYGVKLQKGSKGKKELMDQQQKEEAQTLIDKIQLEKKLEPISTSLFLENNENAFLKESTVLMEAKAIRSSTGTGLGVRVMKGVYVGGYKGQSESNQELRAIESGDLIITNKKLVFRGSKENRVIPLSKIIEIKMHADAIEIATSGRQKSSIFTVTNPYVWNVVLFVLSKVENPLDFSSIKNIDISLA